MYNIYIICKNNDIFIKKTEMFKGYSTINSIHWIPAEFLKVTDNNKTKLLSMLNTRYNTSEKNRISKLGCIAAHRKALLSIINNQTTNNIILEEDATLLTDLPNTPPNVSCYLGGWIIPPHISKANKVKIELPKLFNNDINSRRADILNTGSTRWGGSITAAHFIKRFVENNIPWAHLDIAGVSWTMKGGKNSISKIHSPGATAFGVRLIDKFLNKK